jgi:pimeloyl-ACP methyl ester carboxylesterase
MSFFIYQSKKVYYQEFGEGRPLLLLHGNTAASAMYMDIASDFSDQHKVIVIDFLGHGKSDRLEKFPADLWYEEALQVIHFLKEKSYQQVDLIGSSGGALVAINVALEAPELVHKVIADSFEGEKAIDAFTHNIREGRSLSKSDPGAKLFYSAMHGDDWETVVDNDTQAICEHSEKIKTFFHKPLPALQAEILLTGSREDEFISSIDADFFQNTYTDLVRKIGHGRIHIFESGGHPAMMSNRNEFVRLAKGFFEGE